MDYGHLEEGTVPKARPSETIRIRESYANDVVEKGLQSLIRLEVFVKHLRVTLLDSSSNLKMICSEGQQRPGSAVLDHAPGTCELWAVLQSFAIMLSESQEKIAKELLENFFNPLEEMHAQLDESRKSLDLLKRNRKFDILLMEIQIEKEKKSCLKAMKSLQRSIKSLAESSISNGIFSKMTRHRYERVVKKKLLEVQAMFRKYQGSIESFNRQFSEYESTVQHPLLNSVQFLETRRLELVKQCTVRLEMYLSTILSPEQAVSVVMKSIRDSINEVKEMSTIAPELPQQNLEFIYDLPCTPEAFDRHLTLGNSSLILYQGSVQEVSTRKGSMDRRLTMPDIRVNRNLWAISQTGDSDHEIQDDLNTIEEDNVEPSPIATSFSLVKPKIVGSRLENDSFVTQAKAGYINGPGYAFKEGSESFCRPSVLPKPPSTPFPKGPGRQMQGGSISKSNADNDLSHLTLSRPALHRPAQRCHSRNTLQ